MPTPSARLTALTVIGDTLTRGHDLQAALNFRLQNDNLSSSDTALCTELAYGYLRNKGRIEFILSLFLDNPSKLPAYFRLILGLSTYERLFLDRVPTYATQSWTIALVRNKFSNGLASLTRAYLGYVDSHRTELQNRKFYQQHSPSLRQFYASFYSLPSWIVDLWLSAYGEKEFLHFAEAQLVPAQTGVRLNPRHARYDELMKRMEDVKHLQRLDHLGAAGTRELLRVAFPDMDALLAHGRLSRQSLAVQEIFNALQVDESVGPIWDVCAGRGGKTCSLLERTDQAVYASDTHLKRLRALRMELRRLGLNEIPVALARADMELPWKIRPRTILLDAPCSGFGVLARRPDVKWKRTPRDIEALKSLQRNMLRTAAASLPSGGQIVYITCTMNPAENEEQAFPQDDDLLSRFECISLFDGRKDSNLREFFWGAVLAKP